MMGNRQEQEDLEGLPQICVEWEVIDGSTREIYHQ